MVSSSMWMRNAAAIGLAVGMAGCSWLGMDTSSKVTPRPGAATGDPNLASVPAKPQPILTPEQRKALMQDLVRDRENARYSDQPVRIGEVPEAAPPRAAPPRPPARPGAAAATGASAATSASATSAAPAAKSDDESPWWWPFGGGSGARTPETAPAAVAPVAPSPPAPIAAPAPMASSAPAAPAAKADDDSPWWWPFGGKSREPIEAAPSAQELAKEANSIAATPENMQAPAGVMPVTGKPLPTPDSNEPAPAALVLAPVPATPPAPSPSAPRIGGTAPQGATVPVMPPVDAPPSRAPLRPETAGRAPPPPPAIAELPPPAPPPARAAPVGAAAVRILAGSIEFAAGAATLPGDGAATLEGAARMNKEHGGKIRVVAQTLRSAAGTGGDALLASNALAGERSAAVSRELVRLGVLENAIVVGTAPGGAGREPRGVDVYVEY